MGIIQAAELASDPREDIVLNMVRGNDPTSLW